MHSLKSTRLQTKLIRALPQLLAGFLCISPLLAAPLKIGTVGWIAFSPLDVADAKGFWKEQGLDVQVISIPGDGSSTQAFINGKVDIGMDMLGTWISTYQDGTDLVILGESDWSNGGDKLIISEGMDVKSLKVKKIGVYDAGAATGFFLSEYLKKQDMKLKDFELAEVDSDELSNHFISGRLPLILNYDPHATRAVKEGHGKILATSADIPGSIPEGFAMKADKFKSTSNEDLVKFMRGWFKAVKWTRDPANWAEYQTIMKERTFKDDEPGSDEELKAMTEVVIVHTPESALKINAPDAGTQHYLDKLREFLKENDLLKRDFKGADLIKTEAILKAAELEK
ncbi:MAG: ABC transporter substrate-binding protein [Verrucomicrobiota bacterium]|nr:ABC transporter substrate-binding protein [Verrucomicrobiota bacterium]